ncbi:MAG: hypothetical protein JW751_19885 [Polyangiaceae bacterium]|nr:hypothetical protein [Polyangiaceae bacterium]
MALLGGLFTEGSALPVVSGAVDHAFLPALGAGVGLEHAPRRLPVEPAGCAVDMTIWSLTPRSVAVILRYTLRLLTLDQLGRAAALACALELIRRDHPGRLGEERFAVGLWVGSSATANTLDVVKRKVSDGKALVPKVIAATATVRRAPQQIHALFGRNAADVRLFPPPGVDESETFFGKIDREAPPRLYVGVAAQGRSMNGRWRCDAPAPGYRCSTGISSERS